MTKFIEVYCTSSFNKCLVNTCQILLIEPFGKDSTKITLVDGTYLHTKEDYSQIITQLGAIVA